MLERYLPQLSSGRVQGTPLPCNTFEKLYEIIHTMNYPLYFSALGRWGVFYIRVCVVFSCAHRVTWNHDGAAASLLAGASAEGASGCSVNPRAQDCFRDPRCAVRTVPSSVTGVSALHWRHVKTGLHPGWGGGWPVAAGRGQQMFFSLLCLPDSFHFLNTFFL